MTQYRSLQDDARAIAPFLEQYTWEEIFSHDWVECKSWSLVCHAGFPTIAHKDSNGLLTAALLTSGIKIWGMIVPLNDDLTLEDWGKFEHDVFTDPNHPMQNVRREHVFLTPGSCM